MNEFKLNTIEDALDDIRAGKVIIVVDNEDRENEGDFITAARNATPEVINFMATHGRGLICAPLTEEKAQELKLDMMVPSNTSLHETPFTVSIDLLGFGCTTGISASDRSKTVKALIDKNIIASDFGRPGHIFPLKSKPGGVLRRIAPGPGALRPAPGQGACAAGHHGPPGPHGFCDGVGAWRADRPDGPLGRSHPGHAHSAGVCLGLPQEPRGLLQRVHHPVGPATAQLAGRAGHRPGRHPGGHRPEHRGDRLRGLCAGQAVS